MQGFFRKNKVWQRKVGSRQAAANEFYATENA
jgi:hypothetical protein